MPHITRHICCTGQKKLSLKKHTNQCTIYKYNDSLLTPRRSDGDARSCTAPPHVGVWAKNNRARAPLCAIYSKLALACVGALPPKGEKWTSHSLRKGAASGAAAIGVVIDRMCHFGGWSIHSGVVHDYIDPACPASDAAYAFFGWLLPPHLARSVS